MITVSLILSGTRANILSVLIILVYYIFKYLQLKKSLILSSVFSLVIFFSLLSFLFTLNFEKSDESTSIKSGHFTSFIRLIESNPEYLIWGQGLGSKYYSSGFNSMTSQTELTYLEFIRYFGIPNTIIFMMFVLFPVFYLIKKKLVCSRNSYSIIAYFLYLFISGTNPLLISSTGVFVVLVMYSFTNERIYKSEMIQG